MSEWQVRTAPSLGGGFAGTPNEVWGTRDYRNNTDPTVFFGMYGLVDFQALWNHQGFRAVLWAGSDIRNLLKDYWLDAEGNERIKVLFPADVRHFVENSLEQIALDSVGIKSDVIPSFLGNVSDYPPQKLRTDKLRYYTSVSGDDFSLYGWYEIDEWAHNHPDWEFHLYGNREEWRTDKINVFVHGRVPQEEMDEETKTMTGALRLTRFDGFSEILAKSYLWGQEPISPYIHYPYKSRKDLLTVLNKYPWNAN